MKKWRKFDRAISLALLIGWMTVIFMFSAQPAPDSDVTSSSVIETLARVFNRDFETLSPTERFNIVEDWQYAVRKLAHFAEYAVLGFLCANALRAFNLKRKVYYTVPSVFSGFYAVSDEVHQLFVEGRSCELTDMTIDTLGGIFGSVVFFIIIWIVKTLKTRKSKI